MPRVTGPITTTHPSDVFPTHDSIYGLGGSREVADHTARNAITNDRRRDGMIVFTQNDDTYWRLLPSPWLGTDADWTPMVTAISEENAAKITVGPVGSGADKECDGDADNVQIEEAREELEDLITANTIEAGIVEIFPGTYDLKAPLKFSSHVAIKGHGMFTTRLVCNNAIVPNSQGAFNDRRWTPDNNLVNMQISDLELDGSLLPHPPYGLGYSVGAKGVDLRCWRECLMKNLYIHDFPATAIGADSPQWSLIDHCIIKDCGTPAEDSSVVLTSDNTNVSAGETVSVGKAFAFTTLTSTGVAPSNGDTVTLDGVTYTFVTTLADSYDVLIEGSASNALSNLQIAVRAGNGEGEIYGTGTLEHPTIVSSSKTATTLKLVSRLNGVVGNSLTVSESSSTLSFPGGTLTGGTMVTYTFVSSLTTAYDVLIGANADATLTNLVAAINGELGEGTTYGTGTLPNSKVTAGVVTSHTVTLTSLVEGAEGNNTTVAETSPHLVFSADTLENGVVSAVVGSNGVGIGTGSMPFESFVCTNCITINTAHVGYLLEDYFHPTIVDKDYIFTNNMSFGDRIGFSSAGSDQFIVANNTFSGSIANAIQAFTFVHKYPTDYLIAGNLIQGAGQKGISVAGHNFAIVDNRVKNTPFGIYIKGGNCRVSGNAVNLSSNTGITIAAQPLNDDVEFIGNSNYHVTHNNVTNSGGSAYRIDATQADITDITFANNRGNDNQTVKTQQYGLSLVKGTITNLDLYDNNLTGNVVGGMSSSSTLVNHRRRGNRGITDDYDVTDNPQSFIGEAPFNKTSGDVTVKRLMVGGNTNFVGINDVLGELTTTATGTKSNAFFQLTVNPGSASSTEFRSLTATSDLKTGVTNTANILIGLNAYNTVSGNANVTDVIGAQLRGLFLVSTSQLSGKTVDSAYGATVQGFVKSGTLVNSNTVTNTRGLTILDDDDPAPGTITNSIGIDILARTRGANINYGMRIATPSGATTNYALYLSGTGGTAASGITFGGDTNLYRSTGNTLKTDDSLIVTGTLTAGTYTGQTSITTLGTITTGTWNGTTIAVANGGTGATTLTGILKGNGTSAFTAVTAPTGDIVGTSDTQTLTNKRITSRVVSTASSSTPTPNADTTDQYELTALAADATFGAPTGTPTDGQKLIIRIKDNGTARLLAWNAAYVNSGVASLPGTTVINKTHLVGLIYDSTAAAWVCAFADPVGY